MLSIKPPKELTRVPRKITDSIYKASEWKNFLLYYSLICLKNMIPKKFFQHWFLFVYSMHIFLRKKISDEEFSLAEQALQKFVFDIEYLYRKEFMKYNVHLLLHLPQYVKMYGSLWAWSAFPPEHFNGVIKHLFHGTQAISLQICKSYSRLRHIKQKSEIFSHPNATEEGRNHFLYLMKQCKVKHCIEYGDDLRIFGQPKHVRLSLNSKTIIEQDLGFSIEESASSYDRFIYKNILCYAINYARLKKRNNSTIITNENI